MFNKLIKEIKLEMTNSFKNFKKKILKIRSNNKINTNIIYNLKIKYLNLKISLKKISNILLNNNIISIQPFEKNMLKKIEKEINKTNLDFNPFNKNGIIYIKLPPITYEKKINFLKLIKFELEKIKIKIRNIRRKYNIKIKLLKKNKNITKDEEYRLQNIFQDCTNKSIKEINSLFLKKEKEILN